MSIWRWIGKRLTLRSLEPWKYILNGYDDDSGESIGQQSALKLSAWWACSKLITETIATLPANIYQTVGRDHVPRPDHPLYQLLQIAPNPEQTHVEFWEGRLGPVCTIGNSYAEKKFLGDRLVALHPLRAEYVCPYRKQDGTLVYKYTDRGKSEELPLEKVFHIKGYAPGDEDEGLSPVSYAARSLGGAISAERASARLFSKGLRAGGFFKAPLEMDEKQRKKFYENYVSKGEGIEGQNKAIVMPPGFDWVSMSITPKDAELLSARGVGVEDVCRWMGVPPILIGHAAQGQTMWGSGVEQIILGWLVLGLRAYLKRVEAAVNTRLVTLADRLNGYFFEFNFEGLLRADSAGRAALMSALAQNGLATRNELRKYDNRPAMPGGDVLTVQSNLVPLDQLGQQTQTANTVRNALRAWLLEVREDDKGDK